MMSSDYTDCLDLGLIPEEDTQYNVAPFVQKTFDNFIKKNRPDLADVIRSHTEMKLD